MWTFWLITIFEEPLHQSSRYKTGAHYRMRKKLLKEQQSVGLIGWNWAVPIQAKFPYLWWLLLSPSFFHNLGMKAHQHKQVLNTKRKIMVWWATTFSLTRLMVSRCSTSEQSSRQSFDAAISFVEYIKASTTAGLSPDSVGLPCITEWPIILPAITSKSLSRRDVDKTGTR